MRVKGTAIIGSFKYWFFHWAAFQAVAYGLGVWKFRMLFHDCYKPWLEIFFSDKQVQTWHRRWSRHHVGKGGSSKNYDLESMIVDWECARITKPHMPLNARQTMEKYYPEMSSKLTPLLNKLGL